MSHAEEKEEEAHLSIVGIIKFAMLSVRVCAADDYDLPEDPAGFLRMKYTAIAMRRMTATTAPTMIPATAPGFSERG